jgi:acyl-CoA dehydrogenase
MGFVEETGAAQYLRDARITTIYEGTTGIQANDLVGRKVAYEKGATIKLLLEEMRGLDAELAKTGHPGLAVIRRSLAEGVAALSEATDWLLATFPGNMKAASAGAVPFLKLFGTVAGGWQMARAALIAKKRLDENSEDFDFYRGKIGTARFYAEHILPLAAAYKQEIVHGSSSVLALEEGQF